MKFEYDCKTEIRRDLLVETHIDFHFEKILEHSYVRFNALRASDRISRCVYIYICVYII
jgi:hypothetical protein